MTIPTIWLLVGVAFLIAEALGASGVGLLFAGLGALATGIAVYDGWIGEEAHIAQFIVFFVATVISAVLLWKPMQKFRAGKRSESYSNIVGETACISKGGLTRRSGGEATWSGTIMQAKLADEAAVDTLEAGAQVIIVAVEGATLIVKPKEQ